MFNKCLRHIVKVEMAEVVKHWEISEGIDLRLGLLGLA